MTLRLPGRLHDPVLDLRTRHTEADRMRPWVRLVYQVLLALLAAAGVALAGLCMTLLIVPREFPFHFSLPSGEVDVVQSGYVDLHHGDTIRAVDGLPLPEHGTRSDDPTYARLLNHLLQGGADTVVLTVAQHGTRGPQGSPGGSDTTAVRRIRVGPHAGVWYITGVTAAEGVLLLVVGILGLLALQAREESPAVHRFVQLCVWVGLPLAALDLSDAWTSLRNPLAAVVTLFSGGRFALLALAWAAWALAFGLTLLRLLHVFPTAEARFAEKYPLPIPRKSTRRIFVVLLATSLVSSVTRRFVGAYAADVLTAFAHALDGIVVLFAVILIPGMIIRLVERIFHLSRLRADEADPRTDEGQQARLALLGIRAGAFLCLLTILTGLAYLGIMALAQLPPVSDVAGPGYDPPIVAVSEVLYLLAIASPFAGIGLAVTRRRLWDVDLVAQRATLFSILGALFFVLWIGIDQGLGALLPSGSIPGLGPLLAGTGVALTQAPLSRALTRRFFRGAADVGEALEAVSARLLTPGIAAEAPERVGGALCEELGCERAAVLTRDLRGCLTTSWQAAGDDPLPEMGEVLAPALAERATVAARTDDGPILAVRVGPPAAFPAVVVLGPRAGGRFYSTQDRRMLTLLLAPMGPVLAPDA